MFIFTFCKVIGWRYSDRSITHRFDEAEKGIASVRHLRNSLKKHLPQIIRAKTEEVEVIWTEGGKKYIARLNPQAKVARQGNGIEAIIKADEVIKPYTDTEVEILKEIMQQLWKIAVNQEADVVAKNKKHTISYQSRKDSRYAKRIASADKLKAKYD